MSRVLRWLTYLVAMLLAVVALIWITAPSETWPQGARVAAIEPGEDLDAWLATREAAIGGITPGAEKRITWARSPGEPTPVVLVYLHGFSATRQEIAPVPERLAAAIGANLFETRLTGHGRGSAAMADATLADYAADLAEAMAVARRLGERIVLIGTSTGGSLAVLAATDPAYRDPIAGVILISPNFEINNPQAWLLDLPWARWWLPRVMGETHTWNPVNGRQARYWTTSYPNTALFVMRGLQRAAAAANVAATSAPALVFYAPGDEVVVPAVTRQIMADWGGAPVTMHEITDAGDPSQHVIAGDILSPQTNDTVIDTALDWLRGMGLAPAP